MGILYYERDDYGSTTPKRSIRRTRGKLLPVSPGICWPLPARLGVNVDVEVDPIGIHGAEPEIEEMKLPGHYLLTVRALQEAHRCCEAPS